MDKVLFAVCILVYAAVVVLLIHRSAESFVETPTPANRVYTLICAITYVAAFIFLTTTVKNDATITFRDMNGNPFSLGGFFGYAFIWFVFYVLLGGIFTVLLSLPYQAIMFALSLKNPIVPWRKLSPPWLETDMWASMYAVGASLAYNLILYAFGLTDFFIPYLVF